MNKNLEDRILIEVEKNRQKDKLLQEQDIRSSLGEMMDGFLSTDGLLTRRADEFKGNLSFIGEKRGRLDDKLISLEDRLRAKFMAMDIAVGQMRATSDFLTAQLQSGSSN